MIKMGSIRAAGCFLTTYRLIMDATNIIANRNLFKVNIYEEFNKYNEKKILKKINSLNQYILYNNFHFIKYLNRKDELYKCYKRMKNKFPEDYMF